MSSFRNCGGLYSKFQTIHPDFSCMTYSTDELIWVNSTLMYRTLETEIRTHFCFFLPSNWSCSMYTHFRWNKFLHGSLELIIDSCNSCFALSSIADIRSSVPSVISRRERLFDSVHKQMRQEYRWSQRYERTITNWYTRICIKHNTHLVLLRVVAFEVCFMWQFIDSHGDVVMAS